MEQQVGYSTPAPPAHGPFGRDDTATWVRFATSAVVLVMVLYVVEPLAPAAAQGTLTVLGLLAATFAPRLLFGRRRPGSLRGPALVAVAALTVSSLLVGVIGLVTRFPPTRALALYLATCGQRIRGRE